MKNVLTRGWVEEGRAEGRAYGLLKMRIFQRNNGVGRRGWKKESQLKRNNFRSAVIFSLGCVLVAFSFLFQSFTQIAPAFTLHFRLIPVLAKILGDILFV